MTPTLNPDEVQKIKEATMREVIGRLTHYCDAPDRLFYRVLVWEHALKQADQREKLNELAARLGVSSSAASQRLSSVEADIHAIKFLNSASEPAVEPGPCRHD